MHRSEAASPMRSTLPIERSEAPAPAGRFFRVALEAAWWWLVGLTWLSTGLAWRQRLLAPAAWLGLLLLAVALGGALAVRFGHGLLPQRVRYSAGMLPLGMWLALLGAGVSTQVTVLALVALVAAEVLWWVGADPRWLRNVFRIVRPALPLRPALAGAFAPAVPADTAHQMARFLENGRETVWAQWKLDYVAGTQRLVVHLPICPPFDDVPQEVEAVWQGDARATCRVTQVEVYGVRVEVRFGIPVGKPGSGRLHLLIRASPVPPDPATNG